MTNGIRINMTEKEASSESRDVEPIPSGKYLVAVTDAEEAECGPDSKNPGKPYYKFEFTVQEGSYEGRRVFTNAMLFSGALFTIVNMLKALDVEVKSNGWFQVDGYEECTVPEPGWWMGKQFVIYGKKTPGKVKDASGDKNDPDNRYPDRTEPKGFWHSSTWKGVPSTQAARASEPASLLP